MKKIAILMLCIILLTILAIPAMAAGSANVTVSGTAVHRGNTFTVTVSVNSEGVKSGNIELSYGKAFELVGYEFLVDPFVKDFDIGKATGVFTFKDEQKISGQLMRFTFKVKSDAKFAADSITVKLWIYGKGSIETEKNVKVTVTCNHKYGAWASVGADKHSRTCSICGTKDSKAHTYDNACDVDCNDCGATRVTEHSFAEEWTSNESGHWHLCVHCGAESTLEEHVPGAPAGEYTDQICTVCQEVLVPALGHQHSYDGTYKTDGTFHWTKCLGCGEETEKVTHGYEDDCDETCDACGYVRAVVHKTSDNWTCDGVKHWKTCTDCGLKLEENAHVWDGGTVTLEPTGTSQGKILYRCGLCHTERIEDIPALQLTDALPWWLWMLIGAGCGAVLVLGIQLVIGLSKSTHKGRYSG